MKKHECPTCLFGSGILADGKGTKCKTCKGKGYVGKGFIMSLKKDLGDLIKIKEIN